MSWTTQILRSLFRVPLNVWKWALSSIVLCREAHKLEVLILSAFKKFHRVRSFLRVRADKSSARPNSRCRRKESILSLERGACSCAELQVLLVTEAERKHAWRRELSSSFFPPARQGAQGNSRHSDKNIRGACTILCHVKNLVAQFKRGDFSACDAPHTGRTKTVATPETVDQIHELILEDRRILAK